MGKSAKLVKVLDETFAVRCAAGPGKIREEVWKDANGKVVRYNLAFINHHLFSGDNGRVLGYDTAHAGLHRHYAGTMRYLEAPATYEEIARLFFDEVNFLKKQVKL